MATARKDLPEDIDALRAALVAERARTAQVEAELAVAKAKTSDDAAVIAHQRLQIEKLSRQLYGHRSERAVRLLDQIELAFEELESSASEDEIAAEHAVAKTTNVVAFTRKRPARQPFPPHLSRERVIEPGPTTCQCCGSSRLRKLGEDVTETLEVIPRQWKVIQHEQDAYELYERARRVLDEDAAWQQQEKGEVIEDMSPEPAGRVVEHKYPTIVAGSRSSRS